MTTGASKKRNEFKVKIQNVPSDKIKFKMDRQIIDNSK